MWNGAVKENSEWNFSAPVLFPICGRLKDGKYTHNGREYSLINHGFARFKEFYIEKSEKDSCNFILCDDDETRLFYPFEFQLSVFFRLSGKSIEISYRVININNMYPLYFSFGSHEGYKCDTFSNEYFIEFENDRELCRYMLNEGIYNNINEKTVLDGRYLPIDYAELDRCTYIFRSVKSNRVYLCDKNRKRILSVSTEGIDTLAVWSKRNSHFICIEPWWGFPDTKECSGEICEKPAIIKLEAGESYSAIHTLTAL